MSLGPEAARWFEARRGIRRETLEAFGVESKGDVTMFQYPGGLTKFRKGWEKSEGRKFWWEDEDGEKTTPGQAPYLPPDFNEDADQYIVFEGETDDMSAWQAATDTWKGRIIGLSGTDAWKALDEHGWIEKLFANAKRVFIVTDNEDPYDNPEGAASVERGWKAAQQLLGKRARRVHLPPQFNDASEFFQQFEWSAFHRLLKKAAEPRRFYPRLNLNQEVPETDWVIEDFIVANEAAVLAGDGGVGKSFLTMAMALAIAGGDETFLGLPVLKHGPVLYVDEENSAALVLQRLHALGYDPKKHSDLEYLWYAGVDLLNEPEKLREEAQEIEPVAVVIDSLSRVALGAEENSNPDMTKLMRAGVIPIARESGAAVVLVHHTSAQDKSAPRGARSIRNAADQVISVIAAEDKAHVKTGNLNIFPSKPRRRTATLKARICGDVEKDGWVRVEPAEEEDPF